AGELGAWIGLDPAPRAADVFEDHVMLFSESPTRFLLEVRPGDAAAFEGALAGLPMGRLGTVTCVESGAGIHAPRVIVEGLDGSTIVDASVEDLKAAWQRPLRWP